MYSSPPRSSANALSVFFKYSICLDPPLGALTRIALDVKPGSRRWPSDGTQHFLFASSGLGHPESLLRGLARLSYLGPETNSKARWWVYISGTRLPQKLHAEPSPSLFWRCGQEAIQYSAELSHSLKFSDRRRNTRKSGQNRSESLCAGLWSPCRVFWAWFGPA